MLNVIDIAFALKYKERIYGLYSGHTQAEILNLQSGALPYIESKSLHVYVEEGVFNALTNKALESLFAKYVEKTDYSVYIKYRQKTTVEVWLMATGGEEYDRNGEKDVISIQFKKMTKNIETTEGVLKQGSLEVLDYFQYTGRLLSDMVKGNSRGIVDEVLYLYLLSLNAGYTNKDVQKYMTEVTRYSKIEASTYSSLKDYTTRKLAEKYGVQKANEIMLQTVQFIKGFEVKETLKWNGRQWGK